MTILVGLALCDRAVDDHTLARMTGIDAPKVEFDAVELQLENWHNTGLHFSGKMDANRHARVWVRFYAGLLATGIDQRSDQNCKSHQEKELCVQPMCGYSLGNYR